MLNEYSQWFFADGWIAVTALGAVLGWTAGFRAYWVILPLIWLAVIGK